MEYQTAFDVADAGYQGWLAPAIALGIAAFSLLCLAFRDGLNEIMPFPISKFRLYAATAFCVVFAFGVFFNSFGAYRTYVKALQSGRTDIIEGRVRDFVPKTREARGTPPERFCVQSKCFEYSGFGSPHAFGQTNIQNGPIRDGLQVRVYSLNGKNLASGDC
jgi:hypothetical protein